MANDPEAPEAGNGNEGKSVWEKAGFDDEQSMIEAAKLAETLRSEKEKLAADLEKEKQARSKINDEFMRQSNEIGELRKKAKVSDEGKSGVPDPATNQQDGDLLASLSDDEIVKYDEILNKEGNEALKQQVRSGGTPAMAEFVRAYRQSVPVDTKAPVFAQLKTRKESVVPKASITKAVKALFETQEKENKESLAATSRSGVLPEARSKTTKDQELVGVGNVDCGFFKAKR